MRSKYDYDIIRDYLHGLVDQETARKVRDLIHEDEIARNIAAGILQLEHEFNGNEDEIESYIERLRISRLKLINVQDRSRTIRAWTKIAAVILVLVVAGGAVRYLWNTTDPLQDELKEPYPLATTDRGAQANDGFGFYQKGDYGKAIIAFDQMPDDVSGIFYNGLSNLYSGNYDRAVELLSSSSLQDSRYADQAEWFRAIGLVKSKNDGAQAALLKIASDTDHYKSADAQSLLADLY